jgi:hypothetical protein
LSDKIFVSMWPLTLTQWPWPQIAYFPSAL